MTERERLIQILEGAGKMIQFPGSLANILLENGVTVTDNNVGGKWIPVTERLPDKNIKCLCSYVFNENTDYNFEQVLYYFATCENPHFQHEGELGLRVTHWMPIPPLPELPKGE